MKEFVRELKENAAGLHDGMGGHADHCANLMDEAARLVEIQQLTIAHHEEVFGRWKIMERLAVWCSTALVLWTAIDWIFG